MTDALEPQPTRIERSCATAVLSISLSAGLSVTALFVWWLYEAATYRAVRGHLGRWVELADEPGQFWVQVGLTAFWAGLLLICMGLVVLRLSAKGRWAATVMQIVQGWRLKRSKG